jgi:DNA-binding LacI/PurR family transcriptional regulator
MTDNADGPPRPPRLDDVALLAKVAKSTVSRVLIGEKTLTIRPETRQRVLDAIAELNYRPNARARALRTRRSFSLGLVVPEIDNPAFTTIIKGAQRAALARGYSLLIAFVEAEHPDRELYRRLVHDNQVDGLLVTTIQNSDLIAELPLLGTPYVLVNRELAPSQHSVIVDYRAGTRQAVEALAGLGHRRIAYISGPLQHYTGRTRLAGFVEGHASGGLAFNARLVAECDYSRAGAEAALLGLLDHMEERPSAVCAANVVIASGLLVAAAKRDLQVPRDLSVLALLDSPAAEMLTPTITAMQYPFIELGIAAVNDLIDMIEDPQCARAPRVLPPLNVTWRQSTSAPGRAAADGAAVR